MPKTPTIRGRPSAESIVYKRQVEIATPSDWKCRYCGRIFPRRKSLKIHEMTHTDEKPHQCDYPNCRHTFIQSGQLKTHLLLHSGEMPFVCPVDGCGKRFRHSNRQCPRHRTAKLIKDGQQVILTNLENLSEEEIQWLERYKEKKSVGRRIYSLEEMDAAHSLLKLKYGDTL